MMRSLQVLLVALLISLTTHSSRAQEKRPPNIVFILSDDQGYNDVGCYGAPQIKTPNLDRMAAEGMRFTDFYAAAPLCTPSRAGFLTGCYPPRVGMGEFQPTPEQNTKSTNVLYPGSPTGLNPSETLIPEVLKTRGYSTHLVGKWHLGDAQPFLPTHQGFDTYFGVPYSNDMKPLVYYRGDERAKDEKFDNDQTTQRYTREAIEVIKQNKDHPFFLYLAHHMPHTPLGASADFKGKSAGGPYGDACEELDWSTGQVLAALKELHLDEQTLVIYTSDNGPWHLRGEQGGSATPLRAGKGTTYDGGMRVPFIARWPGHVPPGTTNRQIASFVDLLPTFAQLAGAESALPADHPIDGKDMSALLTDPSAKTPHDYLLFFGGNRLHAVRSGKWKLKLPTTLQEETKYGKIDNPQTTIDEKLYNLELDPGEQKDVLKDHPDVAAKLRAYAEKARQDIGDEATNTAGKNARPIGDIRTNAGQSR